MPVGDRLSFCNVSLLRPSKLCRAGHSTSPPANAPQSRGFAKAAPGIAVRYWSAALFVLDTTPWREQK